MMETLPVRLSLVFDDPHIERAFKDSVGKTRSSWDTLAMSISTVVFATFYLHGVYENTAAQFLWCVSCAPCEECTVLQPQAVFADPISCFLDVSGFAAH